MAVTRRHALKTPCGQTIAYAINGDKAPLVTGIGCTVEFAPEEFRMLQDPSGRNYRYGYHTIQSFSPKDHIDPKTAHEIGVRLAKAVYDDYQCIVATHVDKGHIHNHIISNSVSYRTGRMMPDRLYGECSLNRLREKSDELCEEYGLSVLEKRKIGRYHGYHTSVSRERPFRRLKIAFRNDFYEIMKNISSYNELVLELKNMGYEIKDGKDPKITRKDIFHRPRYFPMSMMVPWTRDSITKALEKKPAKVGEGFVRKVLDLLKRPRMPQTARILRRFARITRKAENDVISERMRTCISREKLESPSDVSPKRKELADERRSLLPLLEQARVQAEAYDRLMEERKRYFRNRKKAMAYRQNGAEVLHSRNFVEISEFAEAERRLSEAGYAGVKAVRKLKNDADSAYQEYNRLTSRIDRLAERIEELDMLKDYMVPEEMRYVVARERDGCVPVSNRHLDERDGFRFVRAGGMTIVPIEPEKEYLVRGGGKVIPMKGEDLYAFIPGSGIIEDEREKREIER